MVWMFGAGLFLLMASLHFGGAWVFRRWLINHDRTLPRGGTPQPTTVVLTIRGEDPHLLETVSAILDQDYPEWEVVAIADDATPEFWQRLQDTAQSALDRRRNAGKTIPKWILHAWEGSPTQCGRKCAALVQALGLRSPRSQWLATLDADVVPSRQWLATLVAPLVGPNVGGVTGGQWFEARETWGSLIRSQWNAGSLVPTSMQANPWAGSLVLRVHDIYEANLPDAWRTAIVDDGPVKSALQRLSSRIVFEPRLIHVNREQCSLRFASDYIARMLTWSRWYESTFIITALHAVGLASTWVFWSGLGLVELRARNWGASGVWGAITVGGLVLYGLAYQVVRTAALSASGEPQLRESSGGKKYRFGSGVIGLRDLSGLVLTQGLFVAGVVRAIFCRTISWRGVTYRIRGPFEIAALRSVSPGSGRNTAGHSV